jgi:hypothetical protein
VWSRPTARSQTQHQIAPQIKKLEATPSWVGPRPVERMLTTVGRRKAMGMQRKTRPYDIQRGSGVTRPA